MKIWTKVAFVWDSASQEYVRDDANSEWHEYDGPVSECKKDADVPAADPAIGQAALANIQLGKDTLAFFKEQFKESNRRQGRVDNLTERVTNAQLQSQELADQRSTEQYDRFQKLFFPVENRVVSDAMTFDTPEAREKAAAEAAAGIKIESGQARQDAARTAASYGIRPDSGRFTGIDRAASINEGLAVAGAKNTARERVKTQGMALRESAANFGRGFASTSAQQASLGLQAGSSGIQNQLAAENNFRANTGIMQQGFQGGMQGNSSGAGILNQQYQNNIQAYQAQTAADGQTGQVLGSLAGAGIMAF